MTFASPEPRRFSFQTATFAVLILLALALQASFVSMLAGGTREPAPCTVAGAGAAVAPRNG